MVTGYLVLALRWGRGTEMKYLEFLHLLILPETTLPIFTKWKLKSQSGEHIFMSLHSTAGEGITGDQVLNLTAEPE